METANDYTLFVGFIKADGEEEYITTPYYEKDVLSPRISIREYIENLISLGVCLIFDESQDYYRKRISPTIVGFIRKLIKFSFRYLDFGLPLGLLLWHFARLYCQLVWRIGYL